MTTYTGTLGRVVHTFDPSTGRHHLDIPHTGRVGDAEFRGWCGVTWMDGERADVAVVKQLDAAGASAEQMREALEAVERIRGEE